MLKVLLALLYVVLVAAGGCSSGAIFVGGTRLSETQLRQLLAGLPGTVRLVSGSESTVVIKETPSSYQNLVVVTQGRAMIAGRDFENRDDIVVDITTEDAFAPGESKESGTNYFVYLLPARVGKKFQAIISKHHPDWAGYFSRGGGTQPRGYSRKTWKLLGYFHIGPQGGVLRNSVVTNGNLNNPEPGVPLPGMVKVGDFAIDIYENSELNGHCISAYGRVPLTGLTCDEARRMAALSGKRLPTSRQWFGACEAETFPLIPLKKPLDGEGPQNIWSGKIAPAGRFASRDAANIASSGCVDMVGNVWEWCNELIDFATAGDLPATTEGYINETVTFNDIPQWPSSTTAKAIPESVGYFFFEPSLTQAGVARGGSCDDGDKGLPHSLLLNIPRDGLSQKVGLRCVR